MKTGEQLKLKGIERAIDNADDKCENWSEKAYNFAKEYIKKVPYFMTEEIREASKGRLEEPPSNRAWGGIVRRLKKSGLIRHYTYDQVKNPKAHKANASVWETI